MQLGKQAPREDNTVLLTFKDVDLRTIKTKEGKVHLNVSKGIGEFMLFNMPSDWPEDAVATRVEIVVSTQAAKTARGDQAFQPSNLIAVSQDGKNLWPLAGKDGAK